MAPNLKQKAVSVLVSAVLLPFLSFSVAANKVPVDVYYESLCPDSIKLITTQITPVWNSPLVAFMNLTLIPYGRAEMNKSADGEYFFTCHHGKRECEGNKVHACALKHLPSQDSQVKFINCTMTDNKPKESDMEYRVQMCGESLQLQWKEIQTCANGTEGDELLAAQGEKTKKLSDPLSNVPTVVFNGKIDSKNNEMSRTDFKGALCAQIEGQKPPSCDEIPNSATALFTTILLPVIGALALSRL